MTPQKPVLIIQAPTVASEKRWETWPAGHWSWHAASAKAELDLLAARCFEFSPGLGATVSLQLALGGIRVEVLIYIYTFIYRAPKLIP